MRVTNTQNGPRGINTLNGTLLLEPGETADVEMSAAEFKSSKKTGWFEFDGEPKSEPKPEDEDKKPEDTESEDKKSESEDKKPEGEGKKGWKG